MTAPGSQTSGCHGNHNSVNIWDISMKFYVWTKWFTKFICMKLYDSISFFKKVTEMLRELFERPSYKGLARAHNPHTRVHSKQIGPLPELITLPLGLCYVHCFILQKVFQFKDRVISHQVWVVVMTEPVCGVIDKDFRIHTASEYFKPCFLYTQHRALWYTISTEAILTSYCSDMKIWPQVHFWPEEFYHIPFPLV